MPTMIRAPADVAELEARLAEAQPDLAADLAQTPGDILVLGAGGKIGPTVARLAVNAGRRVVAVSRFSDPAVRRGLEAHGVETLPADLADPARLAALPELPNVLFLVGHKFGSSDDPARTWGTNAYLPGRVADRFRRSRLVALSTGNVYPLVPVGSGGCDEGCPPAPAGEYAQSCLGRERVLEYVCRQHGTALALVRLNYAVELRYGVPLDVARTVRAGAAVDLRMGAVNVIWQGDAAAMALRALRLCASPPAVLNVAGPETVSVRWLASWFADRFGTAPVFGGAEEGTALLSNAARAFGLFGYPRVPLARILDWTAGWIEAGGPTLGRPTHFGEREGRF